MKLRNLIPRLIWAGPEGPWAVIFYCYVTNNDGTTERLLRRVDVIACDEIDAEYKACQKAMSLAYDYNAFQGRKATVHTKSIYRLSWDEYRATGE